ncbi:MAG: helix-turn-helix transcriptional regulator [Anaerolineae bacterium]|nr:helix-turn-helix transcriptional regulator [Anaerolineae bacterium]
MAVLKGSDEHSVGSEQLGRIRERLVDEGIAGHLAESFKALADPTRVRIISALVSDELCVSELAEALEMSISAISHQLSLLRKMRIVAARRSGRHIFYTLDDEHIDQLYHIGLAHIAHT